MLFLTSPDVTCSSLVRSCHTSTPPLSPCLNRDRIVIPSIEPQFALAAVAWSGLRYAQRRRSLPKSRGGGSPRSPKGKELNKYPVRYNMVRQNVLPANSIFFSVDFSSCLCVHATLRRETDLSSLRLRIDQAARCRARITHSASCSAETRYVFAPSEDLTHRSHHQEAAWDGQKPTR